MECRGTWTVDFALLKLTGNMHMQRGNVTGKTLLADVLRELAIHLDINYEEGDGGFLEETIDVMKETIEILARDGIEVEAATHVVGRYDPAFEARITGRLH